MSLMKLRSSDGVDFEVDVEAAKQSGVLRDMLLVQSHPDSDDTEAPQLAVQFVILTKVMEWAAHHKNDPFPTTKWDQGDDDNDDTDSRPKEQSEWDKQFLAVDQATLFALIHACDYMDMRGLLHMACQKVADMIEEAKTPAAVRQLFGIKCDLTPEEEAKIREENGWAEDQ